MNLESSVLATAALALLAAVLVLTRRLPLRLRGALVLGAAAILLALGARIYLRSDLDALRAGLVDHPVQHPEGGYASSSECRACHTRQFESWHASFHRSMTQRPSESSVNGDFTASLALDGERTTLSRERGRYLVDMPRPAWWRLPGSGGRIQRPVELVTGSHHYQVYWISSGNSTVLAQLPFVWLVQERRWVPRRSVFIAPPEELGDEYGRWNSSCIRCHSTNGRPNLDRGPPEIARSTVSEFGIACESCHGPGATHASAMRNPLRRYAAHLGIAEETGMANPGKLSNERASHVCAQCHSINGPTREEYQHWLKSGFRYRPGDDLAQTRGIHEEGSANPDPGYFWPDGMVRVTGREYHGVRASPCFAGGNFGCLSCHALHKPAADPRSLHEWRNAQLKHFDQRNGRCLQCHQPLREAEALQAHTRHRAISSGAECVNCHMPHTAYGLGKAARSHQITNPDVAADLAAGRPNACNLCHVDQTLDWTARHLTDWYGKRRPALDRDQTEIAASLLLLHQGDAGQRALAAFSMGWAPARAVAGEGWMLPHLLHAYDDRYEVLGLVAYRALRQFAAGKTLSSEFLSLPMEARRAAVEKALKLAALPLPDRRRLIGAGGKVDEAEVQRLRAARDNRAMILME